MFVLNPVYLLLTWAATAVAFFAATKLVKGVKIEGGVGTHFVIAAVYGLLMATLGFLCLKPLFHMVTLGSFLVLGLSAVINLMVATVVIAVTDKLSKRLTITGFGSAFFVALILSLTLFAKDFLLGRIG
ncbi:MAG: phage holin family protein [Deltaproteobacteria bacterium]|nr:phage holin family protein [Deltaproteobacteria bacterium]